MMDDVQTTRAELNQNEESALAAVDQVAMEARQELNKTVSGKKTEVGAAFDCVSSPFCILFELWRIFFDFAREGSKCFFCDAWLMQSNPRLLYSREA
jgi:hypothetical protein